MAFDALVGNRLCVFYDDARVGDAKHVTRRIGLLISADEHHWIFCQDGHEQSEVLMTDRIIRSEMIGNGKQ